MKQLLDGRALYVVSKAISVSCLIPLGGGRQLVSAIALVRPWMSRAVMEKSWIRKFRGVENESMSWDT